MATQALNQEIIEVQPTQELAETRAEHAARDENGKWQPGYCPNPKGRGKSALLSQAFKEMLEREGAEKYANTVGRLALKAKRDSDKLAAANMIADRTEGKPMQAMLVGHVLDQTSINVIAEMLGKLNIPPALESEE